MACLYLPCGRVSPEIGKLSCKPIVNLVESQLSVWGLQNGLKRKEKWNKKLEEDTDGRDGDKDRQRDSHDV